MKLILGLGNPGDKYAGNRHNIGFMAADEIARGYSFGPWKRRFQGLCAEGQIGTVRCILLKPATFMNESGRAAGDAMRFYKLSVGDVIAVHDELDLKPGTVKVKTGGGNAGHNGLKSISAHIGNEYVRVRLGIGHPGDKALVATYVLHDFSKADREWLAPFLQGIARGMSRLVEGGEAAFLSEAARGRPIALEAGGANGPGRSAKQASQAVKVDLSSAAGSGKPGKGSDETVTVAALQVVAAREGSGGGAVSKAVILPEPERPAKPAAQAGLSPAPKKKGGLFGRLFGSRSSSGSKQS
jgi:peptidyl-tRNA hydrolase, PTH1 family